MNKKVLIVMRGGVATAFADHGVDVVIVDHDNLDEYAANPDECIPVHSSFLPLMGFANKKGWGIWPNADHGRINDADIIPGAHPEYIIRFKHFEEGYPVLGKPVLCKMAAHTGRKQMILSLSPGCVMESGGLINRQIFKLSDVKQWAYLPEDECTLQDELMRFTGSEKWYEHPLQPLMTYTDGVKYFIRQTDSYCLLDIIATEYFPMLNDHSFVVITVSRLQPECHIVVSDLNGKCLKSTIWEQPTSIPEGTWIFYLTNNVLLLPYEY